MDTVAVRGFAVAAPIACGCALAGVASFVALNDPTQASILPPCPLYMMTGRFCPGCGLTRAMHALFTGHIADAFGFNLLFPGFILAIVVGWVMWMRASLGRQPLGAVRIPSWAPVVAGVVVVAFGVVRNLPGFGALAP